MARGPVQHDCGQSLWENGWGLARSLVVAHYLGDGLVAAGRIARTAISIVHAHEAIGLLGLFDDDRRELLRVAGLVAAAVDGTSVGTGAATAVRGVRLTRCRQGHSELGSTASRGMRERPLHCQ